MHYKIPQKIQILCNKQDLSDTNEQYEVKKEIANYIENYYLNLKIGKNSLANISNIVKDFFHVKGTNYPFERDIAGLMMRSRDYTMKEINKIIDGKEIEEVFVIPLDRKWHEKSPTTYTLFIGFVGSVIGAIVTNISGVIEFLSSML
jgi:hypothetical protein